VSKPVQRTAEYCSSAYNGLYVFHVTVVIRKDFKRVRLGFIHRNK